jgi:nucleotide-binding universal stress UspA family protein
MKAIKKIAIATDFSPTSRSAYKYGQALAQLLGATFELIHVYSAPSKTAQLFSNTKLPTTDEQHKAALTRLRRFANNKAVACTVYEGAPAEKLLELSKQGVFDMLVMGAKEERGMFEKIVPSISTHLVKDAPCPVLLIPPKVKIPERVDNIVYAASKSSSDADSIAAITQWAKGLNATIHFIHVNSPIYTEAITEFDNLITDKSIKYQFHELDFVTVRGAMDTYCATQGIDMLVTMTKHYDFWGKIFHNSVTETLIWNINLPVLVLHKRSS